MYFDLLWLDGHSLMELPLNERRKKLLENHSGRSAYTGQPDI